MDIQEFLAIAVVGGLLSLVIEWITNKFGAGSIASRLWAVGLPVFVGGIYVFIRSTEYFSTVLTVLMAASTVYALFIKK